MPAPDTVSYGNWNADWRFGVAQGILFNPEQDRNLLELLLLYRGKVHHYGDDNGVLALRHCRSRTACCSTRSPRACCSTTPPRTSRR